MMKIRCVIIVGWLLIYEFVLFRRRPSAEHVEEYLRSLSKSSDRGCVAMFGMFLAANNFQAAAVLRLYDLAFALADDLPLTGNLPQVVIEAAVWEGRNDVVRALFTRIENSSVTPLQSNVCLVMKFFRSEIDKRCDSLANSEPPRARKFFPHAYYFSRAKARMQLGMWHAAHNDLHTVLHFVPTSDPRRMGIELLYSDCWERAQNNDFE